MKRLLSTTELPSGALHRVDALVRPRSAPIGYALQLSLGALLVFLFATTSFEAIRADSPSTNLFSLQAEAFLKGRLDLSAYYFDCAEFAGKIYVPFPPGPALLLTPLVALFGRESCSPTLVAFALTGLNVELLRRLLVKVELPAVMGLWLGAAFFTGTGYWLAVKSSSGVWFFAHVCATTSLLFALSEVFGKGRGWVVGLGLAGALLSRQFTVFLSPVFFALLLDKPSSNDRERRRRLLGFLGVTAVAGCVYLGFNYARFHSPFDTGYAYLRRGGFVLERFERHGIFSFAYIPFNFVYLFLQGFHVDFTSKAQLGKMVLDPFGSGLFQASPFLLAAFFEKGRRHVTLAAWGAIFAIALGHSCYYLNGFAQMNTQRFTLDFMPVLFVLAASGIAREAARGRARLWHAFIAYAILLNVVSLCALDWLNAHFDALG